VSEYPTIRTLTRAEVDRYGYDPSELHEFPIKCMKLGYAGIHFEEGPGSLWVILVLTEGLYRNQGYCKRLLPHFITYAQGRTINWGTFSVDGECYLRPMLVKMGQIVDPLYDDRAEVGDVSRSVSANTQPVG